MWLDKAAKTRVVVAGEIAYVSEVICGSKRGERIVSGQDRYFYSQKTLDPIGDTSSKREELAMELSSIALGSYLILLPPQNRQGPKLVFAKKWRCDKDLMQDLLVLIYLSPTNQLSPNWIDWSTCILASVFSAVVWSPDRTPDYQRDASSDIRS